MNRKSIFIFSLFSLLIAAQAVHALPLAGTNVTVTRDRASNAVFGTTDGGEFLIKDSDPKTLDVIGFCLELNEYLSIGGTYKVASVTDYAEKGGKGGATDGKDPLDQKSKWLYFNYMFGIQDWSRGKGDTDEKDDLLADNVQNVLWFLEQEITNEEWKNSKYDNARVFFATVFPANITSWQINGTVEVLNIMAGNTYKQSLIVGEQNPVPEPATMLLFGSGMLGLAGLRFRRKSQVK